MPGSDRYSAGGKAGPVIIAALSMLLTAVLNSFEGHVSCFMPKVVQAQGERPSNLSH
jgi:hypothetical protein